MFTSDEIKKVMCQCFPIQKDTLGIQSPLGSHAWFVVDDMIVVVPLSHVTGCISDFVLNSTDSLEEKLRACEENALAASVTRNLAMAIL